MEESINNQASSLCDSVSQQSTPRPPMYETATRQKKSKSGCMWWGFGIFAFVFVVGCGILFFAIIITVASLRGSAGKGLFSQRHPFVEQFESGNPLSSNKIAVINITGVITNSEGSWGGEVASSNFISAQIKAAATDESVKAVILRLNTPGGEVTAADTIYHAVMKLKEETGKPVIASMGSVAASGGVYVAVAADYIIANKLTTTGSIGVITQTYNYVELFKKIGLKAETYTSGPMKDLLNGARPRTQEETAIIQNIIDEVYTDFVQIVADSRPKLTVEKIRGTLIGDGRIYTGKQALKYGLVDSIGYYEDAVKKAIEMASIPKSDYQVINYARHMGLANLLTKLQGGETKIKVELPGTPLHSKLPTSGKFFLLPSVW